MHKVTFCDVNQFNFTPESRWRRREGTAVRCRPSRCRRWRGLESRVWRCRSPRHHVGRSDASRYQRFRRRSYDVRDRRSATLQRQSTGCPSDPTPCWSPSPRQPYLTEAIPRYSNGPQRTTTDRNWLGLWLRVRVRGRGRGRGRG